MYAQYENMLIYDKVHLLLLCVINYTTPVPVAERSKARVYGRSLAGIAVSNPAGGMDGCPLCVVCVVR